MLGVVDHFLAVVLEKRHGFGDQLQVLFLGDAQRALHVQVPALAEDRDHRRARFHQRAHVAVLLHRVLGEARGAEGRQPGVLQLQLARRARRTLVLGIGARPAAFDVVDAQLVQLLRDERACHPPKKRRIRPACRPGAWYRT